MNTPIIRPLLWVVALILFATACRQQQVSSSDIALDLTVSGMLVGETTLLVTVRDSDGNAIQNPGTLSVRGDMDHAGMVPVFAESETSVDGVFTLPFEWTMAGGWIVEASLNLDSGAVVTQNFNLEILNEAGAGAMDGLHHSDMEGSAASGQSSAAYFHIDNRGETDVTITSARSDAVMAVEFHQTIIKDDIARMEPVAALSIPAGQALHLRPGDMHIMLLSLTKDLEVGSTIAIELVLDSGDVIALDLPIMPMQMDDDSEYEFGDLVFSQLWARPASAGALRETEAHVMHMEDDSSE